MTGGCLWAAPPWPCRHRQRPPWICSRTREGRMSGAAGGTTVMTVQGSLESVGSRLRSGLWSARAARSCDRGASPAAAGGHVRRAGRHAVSAGSAREAAPVACAAAQFPAVAPPVGGCCDLRGAGTASGRAEDGRDRLAAAGAGPAWQWWSVPTSTAGWWLARFASGPGSCGRNCWGCCC